MGHLRFYETFQTGLCGNNTDQNINLDLKEESNRQDIVRDKINTKIENKVYRCKHYSLSFKDSYNIKRHIEQKTCIRRKFKCKYCRKKLDTVTEEIIHVTIMNCLNCLICKTTSKSYGSFIQHRLKHAAEKSTDVKNVISHFMAVVTCNDTQEFILEIYHINVENVISHFLHQTIWFNTEKDMKIKNHTNVYYVSSLFLLGLSSLFIF